MFQKRSTFFLARFYGIASFQKDRSAAETGKDQTGKETGRSGTDDHRPSGRRLVLRGMEADKASFQRELVFFGLSFQDACLIFHLDIDLHN